MKRLLLHAGLLAPLAYLATVGIGAWLTPGYDHLQQPVSALFEAGAALALPISAAFIVYNLLLIAFAIGLFVSHAHWATAAAILLNGLCGLVIEATPMDPVGAAVTLPGVAHMVIAALLVLTCTAAMAFSLAGAARSRAPTIVLLIVMLATGGYSAMAAAQSLPLLGLAQRFTIGSYLLWVFGLAASLMRRPAA